MDKTSGNARKSVIKTNALDRSLGRFVNIPLPRQSTASTDDLAADLFQSLWQRQPDLHPADKVDVMRGVNRAIMDKYMAEATFNTSRQEVRANLPAAIACTQTIWSVIADDDYLKSALDEQKQADQMEQQADNLDDQADDLDQQADDLDQPQPQGGGEGEDERDGQGDGDGDEDGENESDGNGQPQAGNGDGLRQQAESLRQKAEQFRQQAQAKAQAATAKIEDRLDKPMGKAAVANAAKEGQEEAEEVAMFMDGWGIDGNDVHPSEVKELLDFKKSAGDLADLVGRMKGIARKQIERVKQETIGPVSEPAYTKDIVHLFPTELIKLMPQSPLPVRAKAIDQLVNGAGLLGWRSKVTGEKAGHMLVLVDCSGSMWSGSPSRLDVAQSIAIGTASAARLDCNRKYELGYFDHRSPEYHPIITTDDGWQKAMQWTQVGASGGTNFSVALKYIVKRIRELGEQDEVGWDALFLTDEDSYVDDEAYAEWKELQAEKGVRLHVVSIACSTGGNQRLRELADTLINTSAIANDAGDITEVIITKIAQSSFGLD